MRLTIAAIILLFAIPTFARDTLPPEARSALRIQRAQAKARARVTRIHYARYRRVPQFQSTNGCQTSRRMQQIMKQAASQRLEQEFFAQMGRRRRSSSPDLSQLLGHKSGDQSSRRN